MVIHSLCLQKVKPTVYAKPQIFSLSLRGEEKFLTYCLLKLKIFKRLKGIKMKSKKENRSRPIQKNVRFSEAELNYLNKKIERSPFNNFQNYARILLLTGEVKMVDYSELQRLNGEINRIGNNINQLAKFAHQFQEISEADIHELTAQLQMIKQMISERFKKELKQERLI